MSNPGFGKNCGPFANLPQKPSPARPLARSPSQSPTRGNGQNYLYKDYDAHVYEGPPAVMPFTALSNFTTGFPAKASQVQDIRSPRSPPSLHSDGEVFRNSKSIKISHAGFLPKNYNHLTPEQNQSSSLSFQRNSSKDEAQLSGFPSPMWSGQPRPSSNFSTPQSQPVISSVPTPVTSDLRRRSPVQYEDTQIPVTSDPRRRSPVQYGDTQIPVTSDLRSRSPVQYGDIQIPATRYPRMRSPFLYGDLRTPVTNDPRMRSPVLHGDVQIPVTNDPRRRSPVHYGDLQIPVANDSRGSSPVQYGDFRIPVTNDPRWRSPVQYGDVQVPKRSRSPTFSSGNGGSSEDTVLALENSWRPSTSPPKMRLSNDHVPLGSRIHQQSSTSGHINKAEVAVNKPMSSPVAKKSKLPSSSSYDQVFEESSKSPEDETNRELQAKAKRLMRFKDELSRQTESDLSSKIQKAPGKRQHPVIMEKKKLNGEDAADVMGDSFNGDDHPAEYEDLNSSGVIVGLCLDMCPESERGERERKGDLDQFERLDGDRNQTSKSLAVKKYNRTAEREAEMIRPMPVLQKTMDYLLNLLNQPYDDRFLSLYNFLWDRMRAIRMDLRMQHIFGIGAIKMLEHMIRLHIVAMHELCEYTKGEGFSEGFDAHLNIEQMNKTSVELFQLYDDHRKTGTNVVTEKEFRGYYALLKLDKHPGYKVEPAELSLDLAKMTPGIRQTPEVMFARDVARACRTCNYIAFFNLARKASYLQACLMHAHFAKLRTQALAALHCGLQNNQGIPIAHVAEWLGMEEENIEDLLEYHGLSIKEFEVPYMVKEGPFLNADNNYPFKCSNLVNKKKSGSIFEDVSYPYIAKWSPEEAKLHDLSKGIKQKLTHVQPIEVDNIIPVNDEDMLDYFPSPKDDMQVALTPKTSVTQRVKFPVSPPVLVPLMFTDSHSSRQNRVGAEGKSKHEALFRNSFGRNEQVESGVTPLQIMPSKVGEANVALQPIYTVVRNLVPEHPTMVESGEEHSNHIEEVMVDEVASTCYDQEVAEAKLKLILRIWKRLTLRRRELREQKQLAANAALNSLSLGPPIWHFDKSRSSGDFDIDRVMSKRYEIREKSMSRLNVSEVVASKLSLKNPDAKCLCWKILLLTQESTNGENLEKGKEISHFAAGSWLLSKLLLASYNDNDTGGLAVSSPGMSIWKKWLRSQSGDDAICCLTIIKDVKLGNLEDAVNGASAIVFPVSDCIPWELQRNQLHNVLTALPIASSLPLLVVSGLCKDDLDGSSIIEELRLHDIDKSVISNFLVSFLKDHQMDQLNGFYSDEQLREGLQWLAGESPSQPPVCRIKTRELVLFHLNSSLAALNDMNAHQLGPNQCIYAFNEALDQSLRKVAAAVHVNPSSWPCPEVVLLKESSDEWRSVSRYLPSIGWSSAARIEPLFRALSDSRLPHFVDDIQWLNRGSKTVDDIIKSRSQLESCLIRYLTESSQMMSLPWAMQEAGIMTQKFTQLELHNSVYYIIPKWVMIFQRICHWRLMNLSSGIISAAYMLVQDDPSMSTSGVGYKVERIMPMPYLVHPSLDEMVATGYNPLIPETFDVDSGALQPYSEEYDSDGHENSKPVIKGSVEDDGKNVEHHSIVVAKHDVTTNEPSTVSEFSLAAKTANAADKLSQLLERCNFVQSRIEEKLSIYF